jgi:hypothetical protein
MINLQVESRHKEFFGVLCLHSYYSNSICKDLEFEPTPQTSMLLRNYGLVFKPINFGFVVLYSPDDSKERLREMPAKTRFSFVIKNNNPNFMNFTQVPFWPEGVAFHYSNLSGASKEVKLDIPRDVYYYFKELKVGDVKKKLLHLPEHLLLSRRQSRFNYALQVEDPSSQGVSYDSVVIKDEWGDENLKDGVPYRKRFRDVQREMFRRYFDHACRGLSKENLTVTQKEKRLIEISDQQEKELSAMRMSDQVIDLRHAPFGKYKVQLGDYPPREVLVSENPESQMFGVIDIHVDAPTDALLNRKAEHLDQLINPQLYHLFFEARTTYWRYIFMNYNGSKITAKEVRDENGKLSFTAPVDGQLEQFGTMMQYSESTTPIALKEKPEHVLYLSRMNGKRSMKEIRLPTASSNMVKPERVNDDLSDRIFSEIYVYL